MIWFVLYMLGTNVYMIGTFTSHDDCTRAEEKVVKILRPLKHGCLDLPNPNDHPPQPATAPDHHHD
jgi:hypothetical protein